MSWDMPKIIFFPLVGHIFVMDQLLNAFPSNLGTFRKYYRQGRGYYIFTCKFILSHIILCYAHSPSLWAHLCMESDTLCMCICMCAIGVSSIWVRKTLDKIQKWLVISYTDTTLLVSTKHSPTLNNDMHQSHAYQHHIISHHIMSCPAIPCQIISYLITSHHVMTSWISIPFLILYNVDWMNDGGNMNNFNKKYLI